MRLNYYPVRLTNDRLVFLVNIATGWGEIAPLDMHTTTQKTIYEELEYWQQALEPIVDISVVEVKNFSCSMTCGNYVKCGVEQALLHHLANQQDRTLGELLSYPNQPIIDVDINGLIPRVKPAEAEEMTKKLIDCSFTTIKIKVGSPDISEDIDRVKVVRQIAGQNIKIHLDANGAWTVKEAINNLHSLSKLDISYIEQPVKAITELAMVKPSSPIPIAIDEAVTCSEELTQAIEYNCCDMVVIKPMLWGGLLSAQQGIELAQQSNLPVVLTGTLEGIIARWGVYELARACHIDRACGLTGYDYVEFNVQDKINQLPAKL